MSSAALPLLVALAALPRFELENWDGARVSSDSLRGKTVVVAFTYAKCIFACPIVTLRLKELDEALEKPDNVVYLLVSVNPADDTKYEILDYFANHDIDPVKDRRWLFLNGPEKELLDFLARSGIEVERKEVEGGFLIEHTIRVSVHGPDGRPVASFDSYLWEEKEICDAVRPWLGSE